MSAALVRRGLELLAASEGEEGWSCDVALCRRANWAGGKGKRILQLGPSLPFPIAPRAVPGQVKASGTPVRRTRRARAKASQALKLRNSAKGKVPKSALGELGKKTASDSQDWGRRLRVGGSKHYPRLNQEKARRMLKIVGDRFQTQAI